MIRSSDIAKSPAMSRSVRSESWWRASTHGTTASATSAASPTTATGSFLLAEEAPGPEDEDRAHHRVHDDHGRLRQVEAPPRLGGADDQAARHRAPDAAQAPDDHDDERIDDHVDSHPEVRGGHGCGRHAAQPGERTGGAEHEGAHARDVGAETVGHLAVLRDRADHEAGARAAEEQPHGDADRAAQDDQEESIARIENAAQVDRALDQRWGVPALGGRAIEPP